MSGITGIYYLDGRPVDRQRFSHVNNLLSHRGSDGAAIWISDSVGFGHQMLWTTPESLTERLPLIKNGLAITADARIDNREDLRVLLDLSNRQLKDISDSELILAAYEKWGADCPKQLLGDFAFVIWDARQQTLFCSRDPMGVKPFYYHQSSDCFIFASEVKGVLGWSEVPKDLDEMRIAQHLTGTLEEKVRTFYRSVVRLPAAHSLLVSPCEQRLWGYWSPDTGKELRFRSDQAYAEAFRELFTDTVNCRLRSAFRIGSMLSGGLDSSSIACISRNTLSVNQHDLPFPTFSAIFPSLADQHPEIDERPYIQAVIEQGGFDPHYIHADRFSPFECRDMAHWHLDGPSLAPNLYMDWIVFRAAHQQNVRVLFSGQDGDSTIGYGHEYLMVLARQGRWLKLYQESEQLSKIFYQSKVSPFSLVREFGFKYLIPPVVWSLKSQLNRISGKPRPNPVSKIIHPDFAQRLGLQDYLQEIEAQKSKFCSIRSEHAASLSDGTMQYTLETLDHLATSFSLEMRYPFCDRRLVEFCVAIPASQRLQQGWTRSIQRRGMKGILPSKVQWRPDKGNLASNFMQKMFQEQATLEKAIVEQAHLLEPYINLPYLHAAYQQHGMHLLTSERDALKLFSIMTLSQWLTDAQEHPALICQV